MGNEVICPKCGQSDRILNIKGVYSRGLHETEQKATTLGGALPIGGGNPAVGVAVTDAKGTSTSMLSQRLSPPAKPELETPSSLLVVSGPVLLAIGLLTLLGNVPIGAVLMALGGALTYQASYSRKFKAKELEAKTLSWRRSIEIWERLYYCERDDIVFEPGRNEIIVPEQVQAYVTFREREAGAL